MKFILINTEKLVVLKAAESIDNLTIWSEILCPKDNFIIGGQSKKDYSCFTLIELKLLYKNITEKELSTSDYQKALMSIFTEVCKTPIDNTCEEALLKQLGHPVPLVNKKPVPEKPQKRSNSSTASYKRPREGTVTAKVWDIADQVRLIILENQYEGPPLELRAEIIKRCVAQGINQATASTQFAKWKKSLDHNNP